MRRARIEAKLRKNVQRLAAARAELAELSEQYGQFAEDEDDTAMRLAIGEGPEAAGYAREAAGHAAAMRRQQAHLRNLISELALDQDRLLDLLNAAT